MLGAIIGDICGSVYEFANCKNYDKIVLFNDEGGCDYTDDSVMTVAVAQALMDIESYDGMLYGKNETLERMLVHSMRYYGNLYPNAGYGGRFIYWLFANDPSPYGSYGNGSAMRVSSAGWLYNTMERTLKIAEITSKVTHNHPEGIKGAKAVAGSIYIARQGGSKDDIRAFVESLGYDLSFTIDEIRPTYDHVESCQESVPQGIKCFLESTDFEQCIKLTISLGGDCDTTAAMSGAIAEAYYGIPQWMKERALEYLPEPLLSQYMRFERMQALKEREYTLH